MPHIDLKIIHDGDPAPWNDIEAPEYPLRHESIGIAVLEHGMESGEPSVAIRIDLANGKTVIAETSLALWITATSGMRGAFPRSFAGTQLA